MSPSNFRKVKPSKIRSRSRNKKLVVVGIIAVAAVIIGVIVVFSQGSNQNHTSPSPSPSASGPTKVLLQTSMGNITIQLRDDKPITSGNFKNLLQQGKYDGTIFHRVIPEFMIQGGGIQDSRIRAIPDEIGNDNHNVNGTIAMANAGANTAVSSFFINVDDNSKRFSSFDTSYTVFGKVI